jgi:hypothetical protein
MFNKIKWLPIIAMVAVTACDKPVETKLSDHFVKYAVQDSNGNTVVGVRDTRDPENISVISPECGYQDVVFNFFCFIGKKGDKFDLLDINGNLIKTGDSVETYERYVLISDQEDTFCYPFIGKLCGPADTFDYYHMADVVFAYTDDGAGVFDPTTGELMIPMSHDQIILAFDNEDEAYYITDKGKTSRLLPNGKLRPVKTKDVRQMRKEAHYNETTWPSVGCAVVKVDSLR